MSEEGDKLLAIYLSGPEFAILTDDGSYEDYYDTNWIPILRRFPNYTFVMLNDLCQVHAQISSKFPENKVRLVTFEEIRHEFDLDDDGTVIPTPRLTLKHI